jgi:hypothetical protein
MLTQFRVVRTPDDVEHPVLRLNGHRVDDVVKASEYRYLGTQSVVLQVVPVDEELATQLVEHHAVDGADEFDLAVAELPLTVDVPEGDRGVPGTSADAEYPR